MKRVAFALLVVPLVALWVYGCDHASNPLETESVEAAGQSPLFAATKVSVCHRDGQGNYSIISISDNAYTAHIDHGDKAVDSVGGCSDEPPPPTSCDLIQFDPFEGPGYVSYPINGEGEDQYRSFLQEDLVAAVKVAAAAVAGEAPSDWPGNGGVIGLGDMSEADGSIPGTSIGSPGHPAGTHENGVDIDVAYFQAGTADNRLRPICETLDANYNCDSPPVYLEAMRTALLIARLAENPRLRVVGVDALALVEIETALDQLVTDGLVDAALRSGIPLASGADNGWTFMSAFMHVSYTELCPPTGPEASFSFQSIGNSLVVDDLRRVEWHPDGDFALLLGLNGAVVRYNASTRQLSAVATIGDEVSDLAAAQDGRYFVVVGTDGGVGHVWRIDAAGGALSPAVVAATLPLGSPVAVEQEPGGTRFAIAAGTAGTPIVNVLYLFDNAGVLSGPKAYNSSAGVTDLMWGEPSLYGGEPNVVTSDGVSGADSWTWVPNPLNMVVANGWSGGFGNPGGAAWRPGGGFGVLTGPTSNKLYVFDGIWTLGTLPLPTGASPNAIGWKADGTRALVVGRAIGSPLYASVVEYASSGASYSDTDLTDSSIPAFDAPPWNGNATMYLQDVAWRPGTCDEGLIVGSDNGAASPTFGTVIRFFDPLDSECAP